MAVVVKQAEAVNAYLNKHQDARVADWFLMSSPFYTLAICLSYVSVVKYFGPKLMEHRKPFKLKKVLIAYNFFQVVFSTWIFFKETINNTVHNIRNGGLIQHRNIIAKQLGMNGWLTGEYNWHCQPVDYSNNPTAIGMTSAAWWYYFSKFTDMMDTIFFVLKKKNSHISVLHVVHHGLMPMSVWFGVKFVPGGNGSLPALLNTFVHIVMYIYYLLSACGPKVQKYLWWKRHLTLLQLTQFIGVLVHSSQALLFNCNYSRIFAWAIVGHSALFFCLFKQFYTKSYVQRRASKVAISNGYANGQQHHKQNGYARRRIS